MDYGGKMENRIAVALLIAFAGLALFLPGCIDAQNPSATPSPSTGLQPAGMLSFSSWDEVSEFLKESQSSYGNYGTGMMKTGSVPMPALAESADSSGSRDYSTTNIQVEGVDEADIVKNDGTNLYIVTQGKLVIVQAYPAEQMKKLSEISGEGEFIENIFIEGNKLAVFGTKQLQPHPLETAVKGLIYPPRPYYYSEAFLRVYDVTDKTNPVLLKTISVDGSYVTSRLINGKVYAIFNQPAYPDYPMPLYRVDGTEQIIMPSDVKYFDYPDYSYAFNIFTSIDLNNLENEDKEIILMGYSQNVFVSQENIFVTFSSYDSYSSAIPWIAFEKIVVPRMGAEELQKLKAIDDSDLSDWRKERLKIGLAAAFLDSLAEDKRTALYDALQKELESQSQSTVPSYSERTVIYKISLDGFNAQAQGSVPGTVLNQFSMDEDKGYFRIATTTSEITPWRGMGIRATPVQENPSKNHVFVLDSGLNVVGKLEDLAKGERIYSTRFMGNRLYLVTFKKTDPLFAIDLSNPSNPQVLGQLKIPGYSDYLHPYDENHLIGFGKSAVEAEEGDFAWYQGLKLSLFDVTDVSAIKEIGVFEIGDRGSESLALHDHKAFLFSKEKNGLLIIPVLEAKIDPAKYPRGVDDSTYGDYVFQGAYVLNVNLENGFELKGKISHTDPAEFAKSGYYWNGEEDVKRSAFIGDMLYTISGIFVKANSLDSLVEQATLQIAEKQNDYPAGSLVEPFFG